MDHRYGSEYGDKRIKNAFYSAPVCQILVFYHENLELKEGKVDCRGSEKGILRSFRG
jgi:hypothetical protein